MKTLYRIKNSHITQFTLDGGYKTITPRKGAYMLVDFTRGQKPIAQCSSAKLWDIGDDIVCLEFTSKMNSIDSDILSFIEKSCDIIEAKYKGLVIANDGDNFSVGANLGFFIYIANMAAWQLMSDIIKQGQNAYMRLKYSNFPVISAMTGLTLGGGCELNLHSDAVVAHIESYVGLVEAGVGVVPAWGGCKELLIRHITHAKMPKGSMPAISKVFEYIATAKVAESAVEAKEMLILNDKSQISMNRERVLCDAKNLAVKMAEDYAPPEQQLIHLAGKSAKTALKIAIDNFVNTGKASAYDAFIAEHLANILSGGDTDITEIITEQDLLDLEHNNFMKLVRNPKTISRIEYMLDKNKPLRN